MENANATAFIYNMILIYIAYHSYIMLTNTYTANHKKTPNLQLLNSFDKQHFKSCTSKEWLFTLAVLEHFISVRTPKYNNTPYKRKVFEWQ